jgi:hypothetical protein
MLIRRSTARDFDAACRAYDLGESLRAGACHRRPGVGAGRRIGFRGVGGGGPPPPLLRLRDGTFSRASSAWWENDDGTIVRASASGVLRPGNPGFHVLEGAVQNLVVQDPVDMSAAGGWTEAGSITSEPAVGVAPDGTTSMARLTFTASSGDRLEDAGLTFTGGAKCRVSFWAVAESGTKDFRVRVSDGTNNDSADKTATTTPQRFTHTFTAQAVPSAGVVGVRNDSGGTAGTLLVWGIDVQEDAPDLHPAPVLAASATKLADDLTFANAAIPAGFFADGFWLQFLLYGTTAEHLARGSDQYLLDFAAGSNACLRLADDGAGNARVEIVDDGAGATVNTGTITTAARRQVATVAVDVGAQELRLAGLTSGNGTTAMTTIDWSAITEALQVGAVHTSLATPLFGEMSDIKPIATSPI